MTNLIGKHAIVSKGIFKNASGKIVQQDDSRDWVLLIINGSRQGYSIKDLIIE